MIRMIGGERHGKMTPKYGPVVVMQKIREVLPYPSPSTPPIDMTIYTEEYRLKLFALENRRLWVAYIHESIDIDIVLSYYNYIELLIDSCNRYILKACSWEIDNEYDVSRYGYNCENAFEIAFEIDKLENDQTAFEDWVKIER